MKRMMQYNAPDIWVLPVSVEEILCQSPVPGGNEGLVYEDWGNGGN
ncbi:MAG: hypothetical protein II537_03005 [Bacteroidales bacterium]|nr:hypothetical protein [Bacteroidales bacterium]